MLRVITIKHSHPYASNTIFVVKRRYFRAIDLDECFQAYLALELDVVAIRIKLCVFNKSELFIEALSYSVCLGRS